MKKILLLFLVFAFPFGCTLSDPEMMELLQEIKVLGGPRNGEVVYENTDWQHPLVINLAKPIQLKSGEGLTSVVTYNNTTNKTVNFGLTSEDEMNIFFGYYF